MALKIHSLHRGTHDDRDADSGFPSPRSGRERSASETERARPDLTPRRADVGAIPLPVNPPMQRPAAVGAILLQSTPGTRRPGRPDVGPAADAPTLWAVDGRVPRGTDAYLVLASPVAAVVAHGEVVRGSFLGPRWDRVGTVGLHVAVDWSQVLDPPRGLVLDQLLPDLTGSFGQGAVGPAWELPPDVRERLARDWEAWYGAHRRRGHRLPRPPHWRRRPSPLPRNFIQDPAALRGFDPSLGREIALILG